MVDRSPDPVEVLERALAKTVTVSRKYGDYVSVTIPARFARALGSPEAPVASLARGAEPGLHPLYSSRHSSRAFWSPMVVSM